MKGKTIIFKREIAIKFNSLNFSVSERKMEKDNINNYLK